MRVCNVSEKASWSYLVYYHMSENGSFCAKSCFWQTQHVIDYHSLESETFGNTYKWNTVVRMLQMCHHIGLLCPAKDTEQKSFNIENDKLQSNSILIPHILRRFKNKFSVFFNRNHEWTLDFPCDLKVIFSFNCSVCSINRVHCIYRPQFYACWKIRITYLCVCVCSICLWLRLQLYHVSLRPVFRISV